MRIRRLLLGASALIIPAGGLAAFQTAASATKVPPNPVTCNFAATLLFGFEDAAQPGVFQQAPLTPAGTNVTSVPGAESATQISATYSNCDNGSPTASGAIVFTSKPTKGGKKGPTGSAKGTLWVDWCTSATAGSKTTLKTLGKAKFTTNWVGGAGGSTSFKGSKAAATANLQGEVGYVITGTGTGSYPTAKKAAAITAYLSNATTAQDDDVNAFLDGCATPNGGDQGTDSGQAGQLSGFAIDGATSTAVL